VSSSSLQPSESLDVRGIPCPKNYARILLRLEVMEPTSILEITLDGGERLVNVSAAVTDEGHEIVTREAIEGHWRLLVRKA
jgi:TusA-related sulfurtransferase